MIKIMINTPKGGVGKTTTATNIALFLAKRGQRVLAVDLAGGLLMSYALAQTPEFAAGTGNKIDSREAERVPTRFPGSSNFDYAVIDTDDSYTVFEDLLRGDQSGWRVISPINPLDQVGLIRIPHELRAVSVGTYLSPNGPKIKVFANMAYSGDAAEGAASLRNALSKEGIEVLMLTTTVPYAPTTSAPIRLGDTAYNNALSNLLAEIGI
ncbi:hypothetical protein YO5_14470 [Stutzerimonas stutzeri TS44]|nr:hypothetical protein YO5_14470 [Stutzerimonas stutzeri TS44]